MMKKCKQTETDGSILDQNDADNLNDNLNVDENDTGAFSENTTGDEEEVINKTNESKNDAGLEMIIKGIVEDLFNKTANNQAASSNNNSKTGENNENSNNNEEGILENNNNNESTPRPGSPTNDRSLIHDLWENNKKIVNPNVNKDDMQSSSVFICE